MDLLIVFDTYPLWVLGVLFVRITFFWWFVQGGWICDALGFCVAV